MVAGAQNNARSVLSDAAAVGGSFDVACGRCGCSLQALLALNNMTEI